MNRNNPAKRTRSAARPANERETAADRFEFARRHIVQQQRLEATLTNAREELLVWKTHDENGIEFMPKRMFDPIRTRKARTPEEREELKKLESAVTDARARLLLHENDGRLL